MQRIEEVLINGRWRKQPTLQERYHEALVRRGWQRTLRTRVTKYWVMWDPKTDKRTRDGTPRGPFYFLGPNGSLRYGFTVASSRDVGQMLKYKLLGDDANAKKQLEDAILASF